MGYLLPVLIGAFGIYFFIRLRGFIILHPIRCFGRLSDIKNKKQLFRSLMLALSGTLGVGNIVGVSVGIAIGGAGSVFWLMISAVFAAVIKYAEVCVCSDVGLGRGMISVIDRTLGKIPSVVYAALCLSLSLTLGSAFQVGAISDTAGSVLGIEPIYLLIPLGIIIALVTLGGNKKIEGFVSYLIPLTTLVYFILCFSVIIPNIRYFPTVVSDIFSSAFSPLAAGGGIIAFFTSGAIKEGFARGLLSNEAGAGTSSFAHEGAFENKSTASGIMGVCEVLFDTLFICPLTAFAILLGGGISSAEGALGELFNIFYAHIGPVSGVLLLFSIFAFALSTVFCQFYYGDICYSYILGGRYKFLYFPIFLVFCLSGLFINTERLVFLSDALLFMLSVISLLAVTKSFDRVVALSKHDKLL